ncbi:rhomboid family intramembrane serine protease [Flavobacterium proteolyticum]|uniref:Rhomboid family intramembrane serine protease n=1 Tax=Flavobacterium proteolyticum TaxID=2911683 RepID=A0ABR9WMU9_9FLAO|nr:rhomboid family intramembrane serine protease [Flavobacterium proteolyticum]MBE9575130.1 rhomboid family intramembrane serine protease [Flavobacterium proteolyticum]
MNILDDLKLQYKTGGMVQKLIFWNIGFFLFSLVFFYSFSVGSFQIPTWIALSSDFGTFIRTPWTLITFNFFHAGFLHLIFNLMVLHFSGRLFSTYFTDKQLLGVYILGGIFSGLTFVLSYIVIGKSGLLVGASGAIMAILLSATTYAPFMLLRIPLVGIVKLWHVTFVILLVDLIQLPLDNTGGHIAHLGGALFGFIYIKLLQSGIDLSKGISMILDFFVNVFKPKKKTPFKKVHRNATKKVVNSFTEKDITQKQIDDILDKISKSGYDSLTKEEKEFLFKAGK